MDQKKRRNKKRKKNKRRSICGVRGGASMCAWHMYTYAHERRSATPLPTHSIVPVGVLPELLEVHVARHFHVPGLDFEDFNAASVVGHPYVQLAVEPAEPAEGLFG